MYNKKSISLCEIEQKLFGQQKQKLFVYTVPQKPTVAEGRCVKKQYASFVDRRMSAQTYDQNQVDYFCKVLEGCGF